MHRGLDDVHRQSAEQSVCFLAIFPRNETAFVAAGAQEARDFAKEIERRLRGLKRSK